MTWAGTLVNKWRRPAQGLRTKWPSPVVIFHGLLRQCGGYIIYSYAVVRGCDRIVAVDVYVRVAPRPAEALLYGINQLQNKIKRNKAIIR